MVTFQLIRHLKEKEHAISDSFTIKSIIFFYVKVQVFIGNRLTISLLYLQTKRCKFPPIWTNLSYNLEGPRCWERGSFTMCCISMLGSIVPQVSCQEELSSGLPWKTQRGSTWGNEVVWSHGALIPNYLAGSISPKAGQMTGSLWHLKPSWLETF